MGQRRGGVSPTELQKTTGGIEVVTAVPQRMPGTYLEENRCSTVFHEFPELGTVEKLPWKLEFVVNLVSTHSQFLEKLESFLDRERSLTGAEAGFPPMESLSDTVPSKEL